MLLHNCLFLAVAAMFRSTFYTFTLHIFFQKNKNLFKKNNFKRQLFNMEEMTSYNYLIKLFSKCHLEKVIALLPH